MLLTLRLAIVLSTITLFHVLTASNNCDSLSSSYFQWLNADGSLVLPASYVAVEHTSSEPYDCNEQWQPLPQSPSCQFCASGYTLVCHSSRPFRVPDPASLPTTNLSLYVLSGAGLVYLPPRSFSGLNIQQLIIENTNLTYIGYGTFAEVKSVKFFYLRNNMVDSLSQVGNLFEPLHNLKALNLDNNGLKALLSYKSAVLQKLEYFSLKGNTISSMDLFFLQSSGLKFLDLSYIKFNLNIDEMKESGFSSLPSTLDTLDLSHADISARAIEEMVKLLHKHNITTLNVGYLKSSSRLLVALSPIRKSLQFLSFEGTDIRDVFVVDYNKTRRIRSFDRLRELNMKKCNITQFGGDNFRAFPNLELLSLSENLFTSLDLTSFLNLPSLTYMDLSVNDVTEIYSYFNSTIESLQILDLSSVNFYLDKNSSQILFGAFPNIQMLSLSNAKVDASLIEGIQRLQQLNYLDLSATLPNSHNLLSALSNLFAGLNSSLTELDFARNDLKLSAYNPLYFSSLTSLKSLDLSNNLIRELYQDIFSPSVESLNVSQNLITTWYSPIFQTESHIKFLDLSNNQVTYVSEAMVNDFYKLETLDLNNNPLMCHNKVVAMVCADVKNETRNLTMVRWQQYKCYDIVSNNYRLFSQPKECDDYYEEVSTTQKKQNDSNTQSPPEASPIPEASTFIRQKTFSTFITVGLVSLPAVSAIIGCIIYFKWWSIKCYVHRYFTLRRAHLLRKEGPLLTKPEIHYDVFVSYSDVDRSWILDHLIPNMEAADGDVSLCFHERDFQVGLSILENIVECMDRSHSILLVVSSAFVRSKWCQFEMHLAQYRLIETLRDQLVLVLLEDIPRKSRPQVLHHMMMTKTYLVWPAPACKEDATELFWKRLKRALKPNYNHIFSV